MPRGSNSNSLQVLTRRLEYFYATCKEAGISRESAGTMPKSVGSDTPKTYERYWYKFTSWLGKSRNSFIISSPVICDFLTFMFNIGYGSNTLNAIRRASSFFCSKKFSVGGDTHMSQFFKAFYKLRPIRSKYVAYCPVEKLLAFLSSWHPISSLSLKNLTLKTVALLALSSLDRGQPLHSLNIEKINIVNNSVNSIVDTKLKTTRKVLTPRIVKCVAAEDPTLNVYDYVLAYLIKTLPMRAASVAAGNGKPIQLFLFWATKRPVTKPTLAR